MYISSLLAMWCLGAPVVWFVLYWGSGAWGGHGMGVLLYSKFSLNCAYAEILGFSLEGQSKFNSISVSSKRWYQFCMGESGSIDQSPAMKWSLNVLITRSAGLQ